MCLSMEESYRLPEAGQPEAGQYNELHVWNPAPGGIPVLGK